ncbi:hypothetical protein DID88_009220 [Monilinia fructigena]|uniref:FAD dependent oxidoreductase domain-containing protein n=1 Tax=Monilinia fructigena TaxID=38457 RepID=A0A395IKL4_9HELO|nr:hypothetical protein DID88_009220 [Monilinia fructigena]
MKGVGGPSPRKLSKVLPRWQKTNGVKFIEGDVDSLALKVDGTCIGVLTKDGRTFHADKVILSTGAGTAKLLADSAPQMRHILAEDRITAAAIVSVFDHGVGDVMGAVLPPTPDGVLKFYVDVSLKNTTRHKHSGHMISTPPNETDQAQHTVPKSLEDECHRVMKGIYGKTSEDFKFDSFRLCWDGITPNQDFIISPHPRCQNLYIATGGSFHGWKFLPIIGDLCREDA